MLTNGIRTLLLAQSSIISIVPAQTVGLVSYPCVFCDNALQGIVPPYVDINAGATDPMMTLDSTYNSSLVGDDIAIVAYGTSPDTARTLSDTIRLFFEDYIGAAGTSDTIRSVEWQDENYSYDYPAQGGDKKFHKITVKYHVLSTPAGG